jgi:hypothetical protein
MHKRSHFRAAPRARAGFSRRQFLAGAAAGLAVASTLRARTASAQTSGTFDYYIGPSGSDSNPGTQASPWAITTLNNPGSANWNAIQGKTVGLLDGTYDISALKATAATVVLQIPSGLSSTQPTVIQAVNTGMAVITAMSGSTYGAYPMMGSGVNGAGSQPPIEYITIRGLVITGSGAGGISFEANVAAGSVAGIVIDSCVVHDIVNPNSAYNVGGINLGTSLGGSLVTNCYIYNCYASDYARTQHGNGSAIYDWAIGTTIQYCTFAGNDSAVYSKNQGWGPPQGETFRYNYVTVGGGVNCVFDGFNNASGSTPPYQPWNMYGNIFENVSPIHYNSNSGTNGFQANWNFYNNTVWSNGTGNNHAWGAMVEAATSIAAGCRISIYNNLTIRPAGTYDPARGDVTVAPSSWSVFDYNCWPTDARFGTASGDIVYPTTLLTEALWKAVAGSPDRHSVLAVPNFINTIVPGGGTAQYRLAAGSAGQGAGRVGGTSTGTATDMGAWGNGATQIGCNLAGSPGIGPTPSSPTLKVS